MGKRLLTKDYQDIVFESFKLPEIDYYNYYLNIVEKNYQYNPDIIKWIITILKNWIDWYIKPVLSRFI
jgi:hypothetical protein